MGGCARLGLISQVTSVALRGAQDAQSMFIRKQRTPHELVPDNRTDRWKKSVGCLLTEMIDQFRRWFQKRNQGVCVQVDPAHGPSLLLGEIFYVVETLEVFILRPEGGFVLTRGGKHDAVCHGQRMLKA